MGHDERMASRVRTVVPVWVAAAVSAVLIGVFAPPADYLAWLPIAMACLVLLAFALQLATAQREGFVGRLTASLVGGILVLGAGTAVLAVVAATAG